LSPIKVLPKEKTEPERIIVKEIKVVERKETEEEKKRKKYYKHMRQILAALAKVIKHNRIGLKKLENIDQCTLRSNM
jgi:hypothetical protein